MKKLIKYFLFLSIFFILFSGISSGIWTDVDESECLKFYHMYQPGTVNDMTPLLPLDELIQRSNLIIIQATITNEEIHWNTPDGTYPSDYDLDPMKYYEEKEYLMQVNAVLKGDFDKNQALFITNYRSVSFEEGDECIFLIGQQPSGNSFNYYYDGHMIKNDDTNTYDGPEYHVKYKKFKAQVDFSNNPSFINRLKLFFASF
ncbi:MAG: hypothetical protein FWH46_00365 [Methanimicrococcus sp.]|nr:hypothetical protein [Methanimicrococcus sp.]